MYFIDIKIETKDKIELEKIYEVRKELHEIYDRLYKLGVTRVVIDGPDNIKDI